MLKYSYFLFQVKKSWYEDGVTYKVYNSILNYEVKDIWTEI